MDKDEAGPERTCLVTRRKGSPDEMIRFVLDPAGQVVPDIRRRLPGRGVWIGARRSLIEKAARSGVFARGFKTKAEAPAGLADEVEALLHKDALQSLAMANKAGAVVTGFAKVEAAIAAGGVIALLHASDAAEDGVRKLEQTARRYGQERGQQPASLKLFSSQQLELALGRTNVIHAALAEGPASAAFLTRCRRSVFYRTDAAPPDAAIARGSVEWVSD
jgi:predicted RNA-binding protein YlxR (DUF448 family)